MAHYVLIAGAWHGRWSWDRVVPLLRQAGHRVDALELSGTGADTAAFPVDPLTGWVDEVAAFITALDAPVILVGHSRGGLVISGVAERAPGKVSKLVYVSAFLLKSGVSAIDRIAMAMPDALDPEALFFTVDQHGDAVLKPEMIEPALYNCTPPEWTAIARDRLRSEPIASLTTPLVLTEARFGSIQRAYVASIQDRVIPLALQQAMIADLPCAPVLEIDTDHSAALSRPSELAGRLLEIASSVPLRETL